MLKALIWSCAERRWAYKASRILIPLVVAMIAVVIAWAFSRLPFFPWALCELVLSIAVGFAGSRLFIELRRVRRLLDQIELSHTKIYLHGLIQRDVQ